MADLSQLDLSRRVRNILAQNGIEDLDALLKHNERELLALPRFGWGCLNEIRSALDSAGIGSLAVDPYASYVCARHGEAAWDTSLSNLFLCDDCAAEWQATPFAGTEPEYVGDSVDGFCLNCNVKRPDVRLRQWFLCGTCERVAKSIGRSVVAERFVTEKWVELVAPTAPGLSLHSVDQPRLYRRERGASTSKIAEIDFVANDSERDVDVFGFELKTGKSHISGTAPVGARMGQFQLDASDCDDITAVMERRGIVVYLLHVQVIDRAHPPTVEYKAIDGWWTDVFRMNENFRHVHRRTREARDAAYFDTAMFEPLNTFAEHVKSGAHERLLARMENEGVPALYSY